MAQLRIRISGARLGDIPASDVARLLLGAERVLARAAGHARGRKVADRGRWGRAVEAAVHLRLNRIDSGSVIAVLDFPTLPAIPDGLGLEAATLTEAAVRSTVATLASPTQPEYREIARALVKWGDEVGLGPRYPKITIQHDLPAIPKKVELTPLRQEQMRVAVGMAAPKQQGAVVGRLVEADFERDTAHLRTLTGDRITVTFGREWEDLIQEALRQEASVIGEVTYDPQTARAESVHLRRLTRGEQLHAGLVPGDFRETQPILEMARQARLAPLRSTSELAIDDASNAETEAFLAALEH